MGQQQLLLILLGTLIVGVAIFVGINLFKSNAIESKRSIITNELVNLAAMAQNYYLKPLALGGGGRKFTGWSIAPELQVTAAGHYIAQVYDDSVVILAVGNEVVTGVDSLKVKISVYPNYYRTVNIN
ncbi:MAG: hypothetical protein N2321_03805 [Melioribacteraceae bacterium]|nr:hypothetical protein [Melioribacteraceae bacterium]